jgi:hypothetical protein
MAPNTLLVTLSQGYARVLRALLTSLLDLLLLSLIWNLVAILIRPLRR